ncbi:uncharacterized protein PAC_18943 [Phialocephala subalpina]|uniref:Uncharacterized protein n=1 Tax=Phialocephala subalpina TaxID=576137 RepID=A0A1L7XVG4_9HELO|nr:uncharacterized protein PAC_18943 [Phialocephala subalpina]
MKPSGAVLSTPQPAAAAAANDNGGNKLGIRETGTWYYDNENDDDCNLPPIEQLLYHATEGGLCSGGPPSE